MQMNIMGTCDATDLAAKYGVLVILHFTKNCTTVGSGPPMCLDFVHVG